MKRLLKRALGKIGLEVQWSKTTRLPPVEFTTADVEIYRYVLENELTMVPPTGLAAAMLACKHAVSAGIPGDFVECGVWRGGISIAAKLTFEEYGSDKRVWLFDTFAGMTQPTDVDRGTIVGENANKLFGEYQQPEHNDWCYASLADVQENIKRSGIDAAGVRLIEGDVCQTLASPNNLPEVISVLRLDTDWYESTRAELDRLYPRLSKRGALLLDDFGYWDGARKAVDEYVGAMEPAQRPLLVPIDRVGRVGVKP